MSTLIAIMTHGAANATFLRHLPFWEKPGHDILICTPSDDPAHSHGREVFDSGISTHSGMEAVNRHRNVLRECIRRDYDWSLVTEYDALFLGDHLPEFAIGLSGIRNPNYELERFKSLWVLGAPWVIDRESRKNIVAYADTHPDVTEEGCADRFLTAWARSAGVPTHQIPQAGLHMNTITPADYGAMVEACKAGGRFFHGVKTAECLEILLGAWEH